MNELVTLVIHFAQKSKHIIKMFTIHPFSFLSQCMRGHFRKIWACAMRDVANCDMVGDILFGDYVDYHTKARIWNGSDPNHIVTLHKSNALHLFLWSASGAVGLRHTVLPNLNVGWASGFGGIEKCERGMGRVAIVESLRRGDNASLCCSWNPTSSSAKTSSLDRLVPIFTGHVLGTIGQSNTYFFLLPLTQRLMSSGQNQNSYSTLLGERNSFLSPLYVGAGVPCFPVPTLALHIVPVMACSA